ncbi:MAG: DNA polymerase III subunit delta' [Chloroflexota bacterium]|nr:DNA polymerase III subunit delta' [Chloroflexota bacterium]
MWQVITHKATIELLDNSIKNGRLPHAQLFVGPQQVGKMTLSINLVQALNCESDDSPCGTCGTCRRIAEGKHPDVQIIGINSKTEISIDQIRDMERCAALKSFEGKSRVFIIDEAERLSQEAANCLLKTLEEPPPLVHIILLAVNERAVLPTILSRCRKLKLDPLSISTVERALIERFGIDPEKAHMLARLSSGRLGWAVEAARNDAVLNDRATQLEAIPRIASAGRVERLEYSTQLANLFSKNRSELWGIMSIWISWWRDLLLIKGQCQDIVTNIDRKTALESEAMHYDMKGIKGFIDKLMRSITELEWNANPRLIFDVLMLSMPKREEVSSLII